jgi:hypothetical protein
MRVDRDVVWPVGPGGWWCLIRRRLGRSLQAKVETDFSCAGIYAVVTSPGTIRLGDQVALG